MSSILPTGKSTRSNRVSTRKRLKASPECSYARPELIPIINQHTYPACWIIANLRSLQFQYPEFEKGSWTYLLAAWYWEMSHRFVATAVTEFQRSPKGNLTSQGNWTTRILDLIRNPYPEGGSILDLQYLIAKYGIGTTGPAYQIPTPGDRLSRGLIRVVQEMIPRLNGLERKRITPTRLGEVKLEVLNLVRTYLTAHLSLTEFPRLELDPNPSLETRFDRVEIHSNPGLRYGKTYPFVGRFETRKYLNASPDDLLTMMMRSIQGGSPVPIICDGILLDWAISTGDDVCLPVLTEFSRKDQYRYHQIRVDHEVLVTGVKYVPADADVKAEVKKVLEWEVLNSWGKPPQWVSGAWMASNMEGLVLDRKYLLDHLASIWDSKT